ncbi:hypothetical protein GCM10011585_04500 [Edaphobacter dinghuensis]|uniref:Uncharacterized protein n=1 Tax=Edaphobacter dinghuensis TaxID=1560005 RepID=A0A917LYC7_9BACT|nr:hypothetical protein GCM10011585_04500 [Edaphobacter dinghuensis]
MLQLRYFSPKRNPAQTKFQIPAIKHVINPDGYEDEHKDRYKAGCPMSRLWDMG